MKKVDPFKLQVQDEIRDRNLNNTYKQEMDEIRIDGYSKESLKLFLNEQKIRFLFYVILIGLIIIFARIFYLQIARGGYYLSLSENNRIAVEEIKAPRGVIYDRNGNQLVKNIPNFTLYFIPSDLPKETDELNNLISKVSAIINLSSEEIQKKIDSVANDKPSELLTIKEFIDYNTALKLNIIIQDLPGVRLELNSIREYSNSPSLSHVIGYTSKINSTELAENEDYSITDYIGKTGLEKYYENELKGQKGKRQIEKDSKGRLKRVIATKDYIAGNNLSISIDSLLQETLYSQLKKQVDALHSSGGAAVALDPRNGEVLALVSYPSYDNNLFFKGLSTDEFNNILNDPKKPLINRTISGEYPPGSTIKPVWAAAALQEGIINENTTVNSTGCIQIDKWFFPDWKTGGHGQTNVTKAIAESVNTFFYTIGGGYGDITGLGVDKMDQYAQLFGLNQKLGIDLLGEQNGFLPTKQWKEQTKGEKWYIGDTYHLAIGQGDILVTPLQIASYTAYFANAGILYKPHLLKEVRDNEDNLLTAVSLDEIRKNIVDSNNTQIVRKGLREAVLSGSARALNGESFTSAAKTGTAQYAANKKSHAWFTVFAPYENPEIVITVLIENGGEGNVTALPVAKSTLEWYFSQKK